jgi:hypothetical protein
VIGIDGVLDISVDGVPARLVAEGRTLRLEARQPFRLLRRVSFRTVVRAAGVLDRMGLTLRVVGPRGTLLYLGRGVGSRAGRLLLRSPHIGFRVRRGRVGAG